MTLTGSSTAASAPSRLRGFPDGHPFFRLSQAAVAAGLHLMADVRAQHMDHCPPRGPVVLASNHLSYFDIPLIGAWAPRTTLFFSKVEVRRWPVIGWIGAQYGTIFVRRGESDRNAIREAIAALTAGQMVGVFPEGHRSHGTGLLVAQPGVALLALRGGATVWPVGITGSEHIMKRGRPTVTLTGGEPFDPLAAAHDAYGEKPSHQQVAETIMRRIAALLPESYRGQYG
ncbi:MAG TPA: lysophospholipid acyltransferase family protein [Chloroflexota bacterium]|nr:lysophospholipid acyltransferase family protein [Chloroflexota bacterium]